MMARINEHEIFARYIGEKVNLPRLESIAWNNGNGYGDYADSKEYITSHVDYYDVKEYQEIFGLTPALIERWDYRGIDFRIYLYICDGVITGGHVFKYVNTSESSHCRPTGYETDATQQELRIVARVLTFLTS
jgi:hypothetical protein